VFGWQKPCYLLQDGYEPSFRDLMEQTSWEDYGHASGNPHCRDCMVHSGFEASAVEEAFSSPRGMWAMLRASLFGPRIPATSSPASEAARAASVTPAAASETPKASRWETAPATPEALRAAFEYRGDVTLTLDDGSEQVGYVANLRDGEVLLWRRGCTATEAIPSRRVRRIEFTGRDTASGRSYETWLRRHQEKSPTATAAAQ
jgi:hypothetical protein